MGALLFQVNLRAKSSSKSPTEAFNARVLGVGLAFETGFSPGIRPELPAGRGRGGSSLRVARSRLGRPGLRRALEMEQSLRDGAVVVWKGWRRRLKDLT